MEVVDIVLMGTEGVEISLVVDGAVVVVRKVFFDVVVLLVEVETVGDVVGVVVTVNIAGLDTVLSASVLDVDLVAGLIIVSSSTGKGVVVLN